MKAGWPFPGAHQVLPGQFPERSKPFPAPFSRSLRETEAKSRQRLTDPPSQQLLPRSKGHPWLAQPPSPRSAPQLLCCPLTVLAGKGPVLAARGTCGGRQGIITGVVSSPRPAQHRLSRGEVCSAGGATLGQEWKQLCCPSASSSPSPPACPAHTTLPKAHLSL